MPAALVVLDSHSLVAYFRDEPGAEQVETLLTKAAQADRPLHMTEVDYAEIQYILIREDGRDAWEAANRILARRASDLIPGRLGHARFLCSSCLSFVRASLRESLRRKTQTTEATSKLDLLTASFKIQGL